MGTVTEREGPAAAGKDSAAGRFHFSIGGKLVAPEREVAVHAPFDGHMVGQCGDATPAEVERAISAAAAARRPMAQLPAWQRSQALHRLEAAIVARQEELAALLSAEAGKPIRDAKAEVKRGLFTVHTAAEEALRVGGEVLPLDLLAGAEGRFAVIRRMPRGVIAGITPFNYPFNLALHKLAPAIAAGNSIVLKLSPRAPLSALRLGELCLECGLPAGAVNVIAGGSEPVFQILDDPRVAMISFTGSAAVGWQLKARSGFKAVALELGGNAANIVHADANLDHAAARIAASGFGYAGQSCISAQRIYAHRDVYAGLRERLVKAAESLRVGDPADERTDIGPMITGEAADRIEAWMREAQAAGAVCLTGGRRHGQAISPAIFENVPADAALCREEAFAPVVVLAPYSQPEEALALANASRFGLQAGLFTRDVNFALAAFQELEVGAVILNDVSGWRLDPMPYGGVKESGAGREGVRYSIEAMTEPRMLVLGQG